MASNVSTNVLNIARCAGFVPFLIEEPQKLVSRCFRNIWLYHKDFSEQHQLHLAPRIIEMASYLYDHSGSSSLTCKYVSLCH